MASITEQSKEMYVMLEAEATKLKAEGKDHTRLQDFADHWKKRFKLHKKYESWGFIKSTLLLPIWVWREHKNIKELQSLDEDMNRLMRKYQNV